MRHNSKKYFFLIPIAIVLVLPFIIMLLWNNIVTVVFSIKAIGYLQALGLFVLSRILFGNFGFGNKPKPPFAKQFFKEKLMNLTNEEKSTMMEEWKKRTCINEEKK